MRERPRQRNDGLRKRCDCPRRNWAKCPHDWHVNFALNGKHYRYSLAVVARDRGEPAPKTKTDAARWRDRLRTEVASGHHQAPTTASTMTFGDVADAYVKRHVYAHGSRPLASAEMARQVKVLCETEVPGACGSRVRLETKPLAAISKADVETLRDDRRAALVTSQAALADVKRLEDAKAEIPAELSKAARLAKATPKGGEVGTKRLLTRLQHLFAWAIGEGLADETPFKRHGVTVIKLNQSAEKPRARRLEGDEEARLIAATGPRLQALIIAALETGCRKGELLTLLWSQVDLDNCTIFLPAEKTKTAEDRYVPVRARTRAVLEMRRAGPDGEDLPPTAHVFGNEVGEEVKSIKTAWKLACRRAGITGLHFHDLRRECGSRLLETGTALTDVRDWLGHASVEMTNTYLTTTVERLKQAAKHADRTATRQAAAKARRQAATRERTTSDAGEVCTPFAHNEKRPVTAEATGRFH